MWCRTENAGQEARQIRRIRACLVGVLMIALTGFGTATAWGLTTFVPSLTVAERYDTNVFFFSVGDNLVDFVTTFTPRLVMDHKGESLDALVTGTLIGEVYAENPGLNYIAPSGSVSVSLDKFIKQYNRHAGLLVTETFSYTPQPPAFLAPASGSAVPEDFVRGIQAVRNRSLTNAATGAGSYEFTPRSKFLASYTHMIMRFGNIITPTGVSGQPIPGVQTPFFDTTFQVITAGPEIKVTPRDTFTASFQRQEMDFEVNKVKSGFESHGGLVGWKRKLNPEFAVSASAGASWLTPAQKDNLQYLGNVALEWTHPSNTGILSYSRTIFPSFFIEASPMISQVIKATLIHRAADNLDITGMASYAHNVTIPAEIAEFEAYTAGVTAEYRLTRTLTVTGSYTHYEFIQGVVGVLYQFDRDVMMVSLKKEWK